jgi:intein/homing endonuclease
MARGFDLGSISPDVIYGAALLLQRLDISATIRERKPWVGKSGLKHKKSYVVRISNANDVEKLSRIIEMPIRHRLQKKTISWDLF